MLAVGGVVEQDKIKFVPTIENTVQDFAVPSREVNWLEDIQVSTVKDVTVRSLRCFVEIDDLYVLRRIGVDLTENPANEFLVLSHRAEFLPLKGWGLNLVDHNLGHASVCGACRE